MQGWYHRKIENMATIRQNAEQTLRGQYETYIDSSITSFKEYVEMCAEEDPSFFRWLFGENDIQNDYDIDLTDEHRKLFEDFFNSLL